MHPQSVNATAERVVVSTWVPSEIKAALSARARASDRTLSAEVRRVLREHVAGVSASPASTK